MKKEREYKYNRDDLIKNLREAVKLNDGKVPGIRQAYAKEHGVDLRAAQVAVSRDFPDLYKAYRSGE